MYIGSLYHGDIIEAFYRAVPGVYVRDYRDNGGWIVICRDYRDILWGGQLSTQKAYRTIPATTLVNLPQGFITAPTLYHGLRLIRPGWREEFRKASRYLSEPQMHRITHELGTGEVFPRITS